MELIGLALHTRESPLAINADDGTITDRRIATSRARFTAVLGARLRARILLEGESPRVYRRLFYLSTNPASSEVACCA